MKQLEETHQKALVNYLRLNNIDYFAPINENPYSKYVPKKTILITETLLKQLGKRKGVSDLVIFLPSCILFLELKRPLKNKISKEQLEFKELVEKYSYCKHAFAYGYEDAIEIISKLFNPS